MKLGIIMDPIQDIKISKDSSFAMLLAARTMDWEIYYMEAGDLFIDGNAARARMRELEVEDNLQHWFRFGKEIVQELASLDCILMRLDPPVDMEYIHVTRILDIAKNAGVAVINNPAALRDMNEKLSILRFPQLIAPTLVTRDCGQITAFMDKHRDIILKPLDGMGGSSVFRIRETDTNARVIMETLTDRGRKFTVAQRYIPEISAGDKRILLINGSPVPYVLARTPRDDDNRGNIAAGGSVKGQPLSARDKEICEHIAPVLIENGLVFAGIDIIGDFLTEINITSPTCIRELDEIYNLDIAGDLLRCIENALH